MINEIINTINENGIVKIDKFLNQDEVKEMQNIVSFYSAPKNSKNSYWSTKYSSLILKVLKLNFVKLKHNVKILRLEKRKKIKNIANSYFSKECYLNFIDAYYSPVSAKPVIPWHTDQAYHGNMDQINYVDPENYFLKIFIYLTDVGPNNGCMNYIPGSHKIGYAIRNGIHKKKISYSPYWRLIDLRKILQKKENQNYFENHFQNEKNVMRNFLEKTKFIEIDENINDFDYSLKAGGAIIFNEGGVHRGSKTLKNDRMVLRYLYSKFKN
jgi:hypothetical protein